jgi:hypothetical protein
MNIKLILILILLLSRNIFCQCDSAIFLSENIGLYVYTHNIDSIKYFSEENIPPYSPSFSSYSAKINTFETSTLSIKIKDLNEKCLFTFIWNKILPGAYRFDRWQFTNQLPSGVYYVEKTVNEITKTNKTLLVR